MALLLRYRVATAALAMALAAGGAAAWAQGPEQRPVRQPGTSKAGKGQTGKNERQAIGLPVYTADGKAIGRIVATGTDEDNQPVLLAEIERTLGLGPEAIAIPADLFVRKHGRIELTITETEVNMRLGR